MVVPRGLRIPLRQCLYCNGTTLTPVIQRVDGIAVVQCSSCNLEFVESIPDSLTDHYTEYYFHKPTYGDDDAEGYVDYESIPENEFIWRLNLIRLFILEGGNLLDVGCATGKFLAMARDIGWHVYGVEVSQYAAEMAASLGIPVHCGTIENNPYPAGFFDLITVFDVLEHLIDLKTFMREVKRLLKPGGHLLIYSPNAGAIRALKEGDQWIGYTSSLEHIFYFTPDTLRMVLHDTFHTRPTLIMIDQGEYDGVAALVTVNMETGESTAGIQTPKVLLAARPDSLWQPNTDTVVLSETAGTLLSAGITIDISFNLQPDGTMYDLVHIFAMADQPSMALFQQHHILASGVTVAVTHVQPDSLRTTTTYLAAPPIPLFDVTSALSAYVDSLRTIDLPSKRPPCIQLYWPVNGQYSESHSNSQPLIPNQFHTYAFRVPPPRGTNLPLRLDPTNREGIVTIEAIEVRTTDTDHTHSTLDVHSTSPDTRLLRHRSTNQLSVLCLTNDPQLFLMLPSELINPDNEILLTICLRYAPASWSEEALHLVCDSFKDIDSMELQLRNLDSHVTELSNELSSIKKQIEILSNSTIMKVVRKLKRI